MKFTDTVTIAGTRLRDDGYLVADARVARTGIQVYAGFEVDKPEKEFVRVYRPAAEVFSRDAMASFAHRPVTNDHPAENVTADNWKQHAVGNTSDEIARDGELLRVPLMVSDAAAIKAISGGKRQLSAGYTCDLAWTPGKTESGEEYDAVQTNIRANHVAIVSRGRAGPEVRIGDDAAYWGAAPISTPIADRKEPVMADTLRTVVVDGLSVSTTDQGAQAIEKLTKDRDAAKQAIADAEKAHADAIAAKDKELAKKDAENDELKAKVLSDADLDKRVQDRAALIDKARSIAADLKCEGLSDAEIRKAAVQAKLGDDAVKDKAEAYIDARFDILVEDTGAGKDSFADTVKSGVQTAATHDKAAQDAYAKMLEDMQSAHRPAAN